MMPQNQAAEMPKVARQIISNSMSPFCPGLTLAACPSPSADSLRKDIVLRVLAGEPKSSIQSQLFAVYGTAIRSAPEFEGTGIIAWLTPAVLMVWAGVALTKWLRNNSRQKNQAAQHNVAANFGAARSTGANSFTSSEISRLEELLKQDQ